ncbi:hypothetical protein, partial [Nocardiopsis coralliicola]
MRGDPDPARAALTLAAWGNAWLSGHTGVDDAADAVERADGPQTVDGVPLRAALAGLRPRGLCGLTPALPVPGDPLGLAGPPAYGTAALDAGAAVTARLDGERIGLVPRLDRRGSSYLGVAWSTRPAADRAPEHIGVADAEHALAHAMRAAAELLGSSAAPPVPAAGGAGAGDVAALRSATGDAVPGLDPRAARLA